MIWAWAKSAAAVAFHGPNKGVYSILITATGVTHGEIMPDGATDILFYHGWMMWVSWGFFGFFMIASNRWLKRFYWLHMWIHAVSATAILIITFIMGFLAIKDLGWTIDTTNPHPVIGFCVLCIVTLIVIAGIVTRYMQQSLKWQTKRILNVRLLHQVSFIIN